MIVRLIFEAELPTWALFAELILAGAIVIIAGSRFSRLADTLAERLNLGGGWVGLVLLATVTSLPELVAGGTATWLGNVDLALGGIFGSCCFNITIIVLLNAMIGGGSVLRSVSGSHRLTSSFGLLLTAIALLGIVLTSKFTPDDVGGQLFEIAWAALIAVTYLACIRMVFRTERGERIATGQHLLGREPVSASLIVALIVMAIIIMVASWWLAQLADRLGEHEIEMIGRPLGATFVGAFFLALATSLPEIATSMAAVKLGNLDLALGNIFGSNMFNIFVIPSLKIVSLASGQDRLLGPGSLQVEDNLITGLLAIVLTSIAVGGLTYKTDRRMLRRFGFDSVLIFITYVCGMALLLMDGQ